MRGHKNPTLNVSASESNGDQMNLEYFRTFIKVYIWETFDRTVNSPKSCHFAPIFEGPYSQEGNLLLGTILGA